MPTPGEKRALIFLASVAALGVTVRGWQSRDGAAGAVGAVGARNVEQSGLARQIGLVDSAIASGGTRRRGTSARASARASGGHVTPERSRKPSVGNTPPIAEAPADNRARYFARREHEDSLRRRLVAQDQARALPVPRPKAQGRELPPVDVDLATEEELGAVPGVGPALARRIVADRIAHGPFGSIEELKRVRGINAALARRIAPSITFSRAPDASSAGPSMPREPPAPPARRRSRSPRPSAWQP